MQPFIASSSNYYLFPIDHHPYHLFLPDQGLVLWKLTSLTALNIENNDYKWLSNHGRKVEELFFIKEFVLQWEKLYIFTYHISYIYKF